MSNNPKIGRKVCRLTPSVQLTAAVGRLNAVGVPAEFFTSYNEHPEGNVGVCIAKTELSTFSANAQGDSEGFAKQQACAKVLDAVLDAYAEQLGDLAERTVLANTNTTSGDLTVVAVFEIGQDGDVGTASCALTVDGETYTGNARVDYGKNRRLVAQQLAQAAAVAEAYAAHNEASADRFTAYIAEDNLLNAMADEGHAVTVHPSKITAKGTEAKPGKTTATAAATVNGTRYQAQATRGSEDDAVAAAEKAVRDKVRATS